MPDREKVIKELEGCISGVACFECPYFYEESRTNGSCITKVEVDALELLKEQEPVKPTINEDGDAFCVCGEIVGFIPSNNNLPKICSKYCPVCGKRMKWE